MDEIPKSLILISHRRCLTLICHFLAICIPAICSNACGTTSFLRPLGPTQHQYLASIKMSVLTLRPSYLSWESEARDTSLPSPLHGVWRWLSVLTSVEAGSGSYEAVPCILLGVGKFGGRNIMTSRYRKVSPQTTKEIYASLDQLYIDRTDSSSPCYFRYLCSWRSPKRNGTQTTLYEVALEFACRSSCPAHVRGR